MNLAIVSLDDWCARTLRAALAWLPTPTTGVPHTGGVSVCQWMVQHADTLCDTDTSNVDVVVRTVIELADIIDMLVANQVVEEVEERWQSSTSCVRRLRSIGVDIDARKLRDFARCGHVSSQVMADGKRYYRFTEVLAHIQALPNVLPG